MISVQHYQLIFTECEYTASFCRRGKVKPLKLLEKREDMINVFRRLGSETELSEDIIAKVEEYIALMYGKKKVAPLKYKPSANMWMSSSTPHPVPLNPTDYGWKLNDRGMYDLNWFEGDVFPKSLDVVCEEVNNSDCDGEEYLEGNFFIVFNFYHKLSII